MAKRLGGGVSRAQRKHARARKRQAEARGLSHVETQPETPFDRTTDSAEGQTPVRARPKLPLLGKLGIFLLVLFGAIWFAARFRQGGLE
jgi:hypothetical protein